MALTSWIVTIGKGYEENWKRALDYQLWDLKRRRAIERGDDVFFWQTPNMGFCGWVRAVSDAQDDVPDPRPWITKDTTKYVQRFYFEVISETEIPGSWGDFNERLSVTAGLNTAPIAINNPADEACLRGLFMPQIDLARVPQAVEVEIKGNSSFLSDEDRRRMRKGLIAVREGQPAFRASLIEAYSGKCAVTDTPVIRVLQAAHIAPYKGPHSNLITNGLLLRSDVHTLFDSKQLAIAPDNQIEVDPALKGSPYWSLNGRLLRSPTRKTDRPNTEALRAHYDSCSWVSNM